LDNGKKIKIEEVMKCTTHFFEIGLKTEILICTISMEKATIMRIFVPSYEAISQVIVCYCWRGIWLRTAQTTGHHEEI
jgi:hypothetical protein